MPEKKETPPLWEAWRDGKRIEHTNYEKCIPSKETLIDMQKAGYKFKMNGKVWRAKA